MARGGGQPEPCGTVKWPPWMGEEDSENEAGLTGGYISCWQSLSDFLRSCRGLTGPCTCWPAGSRVRQDRQIITPRAGRGSVRELSPGCLPAPKGAEMLGFLSRDPSGRWCSGRSPRMASVGKVVLSTESQGIWDPEVAFLKELQINSSTGEYGV